MRWVEKFRKKTRRGSNRERIGERPSSMGYVEYASTELHADSNSAF